MIGLIIFNIFHAKAKLTDRQIERMKRKIEKSTAIYKFLAFISMLVAFIIAADGIYSLNLFKGIDGGYVDVALIVAGITFGVSSYVVFFARKIRISAMRILTKRSAELILRKFEEQNLGSKKVIISNLANAKELGFSSDSAIVAVIPKRNELTIFEMFVDFVQIEGKLHPLFRNDKAKVLKFDNSELISISEYFERGNYVPKHVKEEIVSLFENKKMLVDFGLDIEEVVEPQENTVIELQTTTTRLCFRAYKFKEILNGVYTNLSVKEDITALQQENSTLRRQVERYKNKLVAELND